LQFDWKPVEESDIDKFRERLLQLKSELEGRQDTSRESTKPVELDQASVGRLSRMDAMQGQQMAQEAARRRQRQLTRIEGALRRIANGEYGYCFVCGREIDVRRLSTDPAITRCVGCVEA
jgi:DnaK suppressor protein